MTRRLNWFLFGLLVLFGAPYYWLLIDNRPGDAVAKPISITQLRALAASVLGDAPTGVEVELVAYRRLPGALFVAGSGLKRRLIGVMAWRLPVPGKGPIVIDSALDGPAAKTMGMEEFDPKAWERVTQALGKSSLILITHEHPDHIGGLVSWAGTDAEFMAKAYGKANLSVPQMDLIEKQIRIPVFDLNRGSNQSPRAVAPGVVLIPAPSHTPGSQMVFVRLADGREFLFTGDIATMTQSWEGLRARSRLIGDSFAPEARSEVFAWLKTIHALKAQSPKLVVLPGHDYEWLIEPDNHGLVKFGFGVAPV